MNISTHFETESGTAGYMYLLLKVQPFKAQRTNTFETGDKVFKLSSHMSSGDTFHEGDYDTLCQMKWKCLENNIFSHISLL